MTDDLFAKLKAAFGPMTPAQALDEAIKAESLARQCHFSDPCHARFLRESRALEQYAVLLEKQQ